jgi:hypothetical protein
VTRQIRAIQWRDGQQVRQEEYTLLERLYFKNELLEMLGLAGFDDVQVRGDYSEAEATPDSGILVYLARR